MDSLTKSEIASKKVPSSKETENYTDEPWLTERKVAKNNALGTSGAIFHMIKSSLGSGILSLPIAFKNGGLWTSLVGAILVGLLYTHCVNILVNSSRVLCARLNEPVLEFAQMAEAAVLTGPSRGRRFSRLVRDIVDIGLSVTYFMSCVVYVLFTAASLKQVLELNFSLDLDIHLYVMVVTAIVMPISMISNLKLLVPFSFIAICALVFGCGFVLFDIFQDLPAPSTRPAFTSFTRLPLFLSTMVYSMDGIGTVLPIESAMKRPENFLGSFGVTNVAMAFLMVMYCVVGFFGYLRYGDETQGTVTLNISSSFLGQVVKIMVTLNVLCSYGLYLYVPAQIVWRKLKPRVSKSRRTLYFYVSRAVLVLATVLLASIVPNMELFVGLVGSVCDATIVLFFPPLVELLTFWQDEEYQGRFRWRVYKNLLIILFWLVVLVCGVRTSLTEIINLYR